MSYVSVFQEEKHQQKLAFERHLEEKQKEHTELFLMNTSYKESMLNSVRQVHNLFTAILSETKEIWFLR